MPANETGINNTNNSINKAKSTFEKSQYLKVKSGIINNFISLKIDKSIRGATFHTVKTNATPYPINKPNKKGIFLIIPFP